ncbi:MAG: zinc ribbon domain-containing protein [Deltaproteobacteria bacterium]|nr:zinc ribbon domain-containing protein [Deltaproteobacteria bacterium]
MPLCSVCGKQNREQARFCGYCGRPLPNAPARPTEETRPVSRAPSSAGWLRHLPGFRSGQRWKQLMATAAYSLIALAIGGGAIADNAALLLLGMDTLAIVLFATNAWNLRSRVPLLSSPSTLKAASGWGMLVLLGVGALSVVVSTLPKAPSTASRLLPDLASQPPSAKPGEKVPLQRTPLPPDDVLQAKLLEVGSAMGWSLAYEDRTEGLFIWRFKIKGRGREQSSYECEGRFTWYMKRVGDQIGVDDPVMVLPPCPLDLPQLQAEIRRLQKDFNQRWLALVGPVTLTGPTSATHSLERQTEALNRTIPQLPVAPPTPKKESDIQRYYPQREDTVRWYVVKEMQTGQAVDFISFAIVGKTTLDNGRTVYLIENRTAQGISLDYQEITPDQVLLHRLVQKGPALDTVDDVRFTPPLPSLRSPLAVGRSWRASVGGGNVTQSYSYQVEARVTVAALGKEVRDCLRVVRTRDGTPDYKTEYCPEIGIAALEMLTPQGKWLRAELFETTTARLSLKGLRAAAGHCVYVLDGTGFSLNENLILTVLGPGDKPSKEQIHAAANIDIALDSEQQRGRVLISLEGTLHKASYTIDWKGECRASFLASPPVFRPSLTLIGQEADKQGQMSSILVGSGWRAGESLHFITEGPGWNKGSFPLGTANDLGVSGIAIVPFRQNPLDGEYTFTLQGETQTATLTVICQTGLCFVQ